MNSKFLNFTSVSLGAMGIIIMFFSILETPLRFARTIEAPINDTPIISNNEKELHVLKNSYKTGKNPFSEQEFSKAPKVFMGGSFSKVIITINGTITGKNNIFLILNFNGQGGVIKAVRSAKTKLDLDLTQKNGGIFSENPIIATVDLLQDTLGTLSGEFEKTGLGSRTFYFLQREQNPTVSPLLVVPFSTSGEYGGALINQLTIKYSCQEDKNCVMGTCLENEKTTECLKRNFDEKVVELWMKENNF